MKKLFLTWFCISLSFIASSQQTVSINGIVTDIEKKGIRGASLRILNSNTGTVTDSLGAFILNVFPGTISIEISAGGYATEIRSIIATSNTSQLSIPLQRSAKTLDAVVVTAQKTEELLQELPISITALSAKQVKEYRLWNSKDIAAIVPNMYAADPGDRRNVFSLRGIATTSYDPAMATYIDGVNQFSLDTYIAQLFDVERIEILRGAQGTLYGRNAMAGVMNIITRQPGNKPGGFAEITTGSDGLQRYSAGLRAPLLKDKLYIGIAGLYDRSDGFYTNEFNNSKFDKQESFTGNYYLKWLPSKTGWDNNNWKSKTKSCKRNFSSHPSDGFFAVGRVIKPSHTKISKANASKNPTYLPQIPS